MNRYLRWLWRRTPGRRRLPARPVIPASVDPRAVQPPLPLFGFALDQLSDWFAGITIDDSEPGALAGYARHDIERFLRTVDLTPGQARRGLEIGANPYFTTTLLGWLRPRLRLDLTNYFSAEAATGRQHVVVTGPRGQEVRDVDYASVNVETTRLPFDDAAFDLVLYCEVLEHMTDDPVATLREIHRVIEPGGVLVLTTPNAVRLENVTRMIAGLNIYDQYSGYGPYGRHNREYTVAEVRALLVHCGFVEDCLYTADVHDNHAALHVRDPRSLVDLCGARADLLGQYIFSRWRRGEAAGMGRPSWLYRSRAVNDLSGEVPLIDPPGSRF